ncbi:polysaccharide biosynthesis protein, partial [Amylibacter sp.]|nr:polysaccharide biosynthesis protein [Amylibacter sp.]
MDILKIINRKQALFRQDLEENEEEIRNIIQSNRFLVIGGGGSIGQAISKEIFKRNAKTLHVVDLNENYLVELVRDIRSKFGYITTDFDTFALDCGSATFQKFIQEAEYDYILNLSAMKHVRSENNPYSMERMMQC